MKKDPKKILIVRNDHIGDFVLTTSVFRELKKKYPKSKIILITSKSNLALAEKNKNIDEIWELEIPQYKLGTIWRYLKTAWRIRKEKFDVGIDFRGSLLISSLLLWLGGVKKRIGKCDNYHNNKLNFLVSLFQTDPVITNYYTNKRHITKENLYIVNKGLGTDIKKNWPEICFDLQDKKEVEEFLNKNNLKEYICIFPLTDAPSKQWPLENFEELLKWLRDCKEDILLIGTKNHLSELEKLTKINKRCKIITGFNLRKLAILFNKSKFVLAHDGGPFHIAWASGARTIELVRNFPPELAAGKFCALGKTDIIWSNSNDIRDIKISRVKEVMKKYLAHFL